MILYISCRCLHGSVQVTLVYRIDVQTQINVQVEKFYKKNKRAGHIRRAGGFFSSEKSINVQVGINVQGGILFSKYQ